MRVELHLSILGVPQFWKRRRSGRRNDKCIKACFGLRCLVCLCMQGSDEKRRAATSKASEVTSRRTMDL